MGLGKTLQSIAFLQHLKDQQNGKKTSPSLIVAPTSLMFNWVAEFEKFAPKLNFLLYYGSNRETLRNEINTTDIVLTTYGSLVKDIEFHQT
jgi:non-specific serine/threonine protein kinase